MRVWPYSNSDYTVHTARDYAELFALPAVVEYVGLAGPRYYRLSVSATGVVRAPWDRDLALPLLMLELDGGEDWWPLAGLESPELYGLPLWCAL